MCNTYLWSTSSAERDELFWNDLFVFQSAQLFLPFFVCRLPKLLKVTAMHILNCLSRSQSQLWIQIAVSKTYIFPVCRASIAVREHELPQWPHKSKNYLKKKPHFTCTWKCQIRLSSYLKLGTLFFLSLCNEWFVQRLNHKLFFFFLQTSENYRELYFVISHLPSNGLIS